MSSFKRWFNQRLWSHRIRTGRGRLYEICGHAWCMRLAHYDHRCVTHQGDNFPLSAQ